MTSLPTIIHLVDDTTPGGVMRVLNHIATCPKMSAHAQHIIRTVTRRKALPQVEGDVVVSHLSLSWRALPKLISFRARHATTPLVHVEHSYTQAFTALNVPAKTRFYAMLRTAFSLFDRVVAVSQAQADWLGERGLVRSSALQVIRSTVDLATFRAMPAATRAGKRIGAFGRLDRQKGFDLLIPAFRQIEDPEARLIFFGEGPEEEHLRELAGPDSRIEFRGRVDSPAAAMATVDAIAMPSRWEAYGLVALEARAAGLPLAVAAVDGLNDQAVPGVITVQGAAASEWTQALKTLVQTDPSPDLRASCANAETEFAQGWQQLVDGLLGKTAQPIIANMIAQPRALAA